MKDSATQIHCNICNIFTINDYKKQYEYYAKNPDEYTKRKKKFEKLLKKTGAA